MLRQIITPQNPVVTVRLPNEMVGKTIELIAFEIEKDAVENDVSTKEQRLKRIEELTSGSIVDLSNFKFDRDEANNYEE